MKHPDTQRDCPGPWVGYKCTKLVKPSTLGVVICDYGRSYSFVQCATQILKFSIGAMMQNILGSTEIGTMMQNIKN